jgi:hypothetical protein
MAETAADLFLSDIFPKSVVVTCGEGVSRADLQIIRAVTVSHIGWPCRTHSIISGIFITPP